MANDSDIADTDSDNDVFDLDDVGTKKKRYDAETPSDARDDFDFDAPSKPKAKKRVIADSDDSEEDSAPKFVNWKMKEKQKKQRQNRPSTQSSTSTAPQPEPQSEPETDEDHDPPAVKRYDSDTDTKKDEEESAEDSRERSQYNNYYEYDLDLEESDTKKEHEPKRTAPITPITPYEEQQKQRRTPKKADKKPMFSTYIEPLQDAPEPSESNTEPEPHSNSDLQQKQSPQYDDLDEKQPSKYDDNEAPAAVNRSQYENKRMSSSEFGSVALAEIFENDNTLQDHFDIAKKICKYYDEQLDDRNTVCVVSEPGKQPAISYWVNGDYVRKESNIGGKDLLIYRAISHKEAKKPIVSQSQFEAFVKQISVDYEQSSVDAICDMMDDKFGKGCHYARSKQKTPEFDIYARFTDKYDASFRLPSGAYVIAWRR
eukprot:233512_1